MIDSTKKNSKYFLLYDLETSNREFSSQILTAYFQLVDENFTPTGQDLNLKIQISRLELPHPQAILVNRINVLEHQKNSIPEHLAAQEIYHFINECLQFTGDYNLKLLGYNSGNFDLPFLRTVLIRNALNPYFMGKLQYGDGLNLVRKIAWNFPENFPRQIKENNGVFFHSYSLENICRGFNLLNGQQQQHDAKADVDLLRELLVKIQQIFAIKINHLSEFNVPEQQIFCVKVPTSSPIAPPPQYELRPYYLLDHIKNQYLFVDLLKFQENPTQESIIYKNQQTGYLFPDETDPFTPFQLSQKIIFQIRQNLAGITCDNFFDLTDCDIEQDIYRLSFNNIHQFQAKIQGETVDIQNQDLKNLWNRYALKIYHATPEQDQTLHNNFQKTFCSYVKERYLKGFKLNKFGQETELSPNYHELYNAVQQSLTEASSEEDRQLMLALKTFYENSEIFQVIQSI